MAPSLLIESVRLDGPTAVLSFRATVRCFACELRQTNGEARRRAPTTRLGRDDTCRIELPGLAFGEYELLALTDAGPIEIGPNPRGHQPAPGTDAAEAHSDTLARSSFSHAGTTTWSLVYRDPATGRLRLRLASSDDAAQFLADLRPQPLRFSAICAVYNVARYLGDFLNSIVDQSLDFQRHIELILVDDGSTDESPKIIKRWQKRYPDAIRYLRKQNGGPASARNLGLQHASHDWLTFCDPDDFFDRDYFSEVARAIRSHGEERVAMVSCNIINHYEASNLTRDDHYLRFKFAAGTQTIPAEDLGRFIQFNANSAFVSRRILADADLRFDVRVRPNFEDTHFIQRYLLTARERDVVLLPDARYFHRHRANRTSLVQMAPRDPDWYGDQLEFGYLELMRECKARTGAIPRHVVNTIISDLRRQLREVVDRANAVAFLGEERQQRFRNLLEEIFREIDPRAIYDFDVAGLSFLMRVGILHAFKRTPPPYRRVECQRVDSARRQLLLVYFSENRHPSGRFWVDDQITAPVYSKTIRHEFLGEDFAWEHIAWLPIGDGRRLRAEVEGSAAVIDFDGRRYEDALPVDAIVTDRGRRATGGLHDAVDLGGPAHRGNIPDGFRQAWVFLDRDDMADDNAEHLYRHVRHRHPEINAFFVLKPDTPDWRRLLQEGFRLLPFNSPEHAHALRNAEVLVSSQADHYVTEFLDRRRFRDLAYRFVFLQHGVTKDDMSDWLNEKDADLVIACSPREYRSFVEDGSRYRLTERDVALTGFPRHDALLASAPPAERPVIAVMPTWRASLTGPAVGPGRARTVDDAFYQSKFAIAWKKFLHSSRLAEIARVTGSRVVLVVHPHLEQYLDFFDLPRSIKIHRLGADRSIQTVLRAATVLVTDFSSTAFEIAYLLKPVVYYQFDRDIVFGGGHLTGKGYFDYDRDGFGPVVTRQTDLLDALSSLLVGNQPPDPEYRRRAEETFAFRDGNCCARVYDAVIDLVHP